MSTSAHDSGPTIPGSASATSKFEEAYRSNVRDITRYFARRWTEPQLVADLTSETFTRAITSYSTYDARRGSERAWLVGIARHVHADHCDRLERLDDVRVRAAVHVELSIDATDDVIARIDAERDAREVLAALASLPEIDRSIIELVDIAGLSQRETAAVLGLSHGAMRVRLMRLRRHLARAARR